MAFQPDSTSLLQYVIQAINSYWKINKLITTSKFHTKLQFWQNVCLYNRHLTICTETMYKNNIFRQTPIKLTYCMYWGSVSFSKLRVFPLSLLIEGLIQNQSEIELIFDVPIWLWMESCSLWILLIVTICLKYDWHDIANIFLEKDIATPLHFFNTSANIEVHMHAYSSPTCKDLFFH